MRAADAYRGPEQRVAAPKTDTGRLRTVLVGGRPVAEVESVYVRGLIRAQARLAGGVLVAFCVTAGALVAVLLAIPALNEIVLFDVPLPWLLHAYGFYPIILGFALVYAFAAARNERRYRALAGREE